MKMLIILLAPIVLFSLGIFANDGCQHKCQEEMTCHVQKITNVCYYIFHNGKRTWEENRKLCDDKELTMGKICENQIKTFSIQELMQDLDPNVNAWLGGTAEDLDEWTFINNVTISETHANVPTDFIEGQEMHVCGVVHANGTLDKYDCTKMRHYICRFEQLAGISTYHISESPKIWFEARAQCDKMGGYLFSLKKNEDINFIKSQLKSLNFKNQTLFIGLIRRRWVWQDGQDIIFHNWAVGKPNKLLWRCMSVIQRDAVWTDADCTEKMYTLCQRGLTGKPTAEIEEKRDTIQIPVLVVPIVFLITILTIIIMAVVFYKKYRKKKKEEHSYTEAPHLETTTSFQNALRKTINTKKSEQPDEDVFEKEIAIHQHKSEENKSDMDHPHLRERRKAKSLIHKIMRERTVQLYQPAEDVAEPRIEIEQAESLEKGMVTGQTVQLYQPAEDVAQPRIEIGQAESLEKGMVTGQPHLRERRKAKSLIHKIMRERTKATLPGPSECISLLRNVKDNLELDRHGKKILRLLQEDQKSILENDPNILTVLIKKADKLIDSKYYEDIIKVAPHGGKDSPLEYLLGILRSGEENFKKLFKDQKKLMSVIQIISSYGDVQYRTECLRDIIFTWTFRSSGNRYTFEWSEEYLSTLKDLLENGADPTWIHPKDLKKKRRDRSTAQNGFFFRIFVNLWEKNDLHESLLQVLPLMLSKKCKDNELLPGTLLHRFVYPRWDYIATNRESIPPDFFRQFRNILREILRQDGTLLVQKDCFLGRTPLQYFLIGIELEERIFGEVREIIQMLQTPQVLSSQNDNGQNALHYLAGYFPVIRGEVTQSGRESFLDLVKSFANESNVGCQDEDGRTALHHLAKKFRYEISEEWREVYQDFMKHLANYDILEIKDKKGRTALHFLADGFTFEIEDWKMETFVEVLKCLAVPRTIRIKHPSLGTALEIISRNKVPEHYKDKYKEISDILSGK